jgi:O-antigen ligase
MALVIIWLSARLVWRRGALLSIMGAWVGGSAVNAAVAVLQSSGLLTFGIVEFGRVAGLTTHFNELGAVCALALFPAIYLLTSTPSGIKRRAFALAGVLVLAAGLLASGSVAALGAAVLGAGYWFATGAVLVRIVVVVALLAAFGLVLSGGFDPWERLSQTLNPSTGAVGSVESRLRTLEDAWSQIARSPVLGKGLDDESSRTRVVGPELQADGSVVYRPHQVHNLFLGAWFQAGVVGFISMLILWFGVARAGFKASALARSIRDLELSVALQASYAFFTVFSLAAVVTQQRFLWLPAGLLLAASWHATIRARALP